MQKLGKVGFREEIIAELITRKKNKVFYDKN